MHLGENSINMLRILKKIGMYILILLVLLVVGTLVFVNTSPQFGQVPKGEDLKRIKQSEHFEDGVFMNLVETTVGDFWTAMKKLPEMLSTKGKIPESALPTTFDDHLLHAADSAVHITWFGHSAFLIEAFEKKMLIDPMLSEYPSPLPFGTKRFEYRDTIPSSQLKNIDVVLISHDHYDHLDYPTITKIKDEVKLFVTPLGVGSHLKKWGVPSEKIVELDWWQENMAEGFKLTACPSRHFSGRGLTDRNATQWASWVIETDTVKLYFSGDGGYGAHFKEIGNKYGPFDLAFLECGQYNEAWADIHMMPEQSVQAAVDLNAKLAMPIHWGAFLLAPHHWKDPIERFSKTADEQGLEFMVPEIGKPYTLGTEAPQSEWWVKAD